MRPVSSFAAACAGAMLLAPAAVYAQPGGQGSNPTEPVELQTRGVSYRVVPLVSDEPWYRPGMEMPRMHWVPAVSPLSIMFYTGEQFPDWKNSAFVGALTTRVLLRLSFGNPSQDERRDTLLGQFRLRVRDIAQGPDELIYLATELSFGGANADGTILRIEPVE